MRIDQHLTTNGRTRLAITDKITTAASAPHTTHAVVDLAEITFCDSRGIAALVRARTTSVQIIKPPGHRPPDPRHHRRPGHPVPPITRQTRTQPEFTCPAVG